MPRTKTTPMDFIVTALKKNKAMSYGDLKAAADKKRLTVYPIMYGRAKALLGLVKSAPRGQGKAKRAAAARLAAGTAKRGPGRPRGSKNRVASSNGSLDSLMTEVRAMVRERDALRRTLEQVSAKLAGVV